MSRPLVVGEGGEGGWEGMGAETQERGLNVQCVCMQ